MSKSNRRSKRQTRDLLIRASLASLIIFLFGSALFALLTRQTYSDIDSSLNNHWFELVIPSNNPSEKNGVFNYNKIATNGEECIDRKPYNFEFMRVLGHLPSSTNKEKRILIVGSHTALGASLIRKYEKKNVPYTAIRGIDDVDFSSDSIEKLFQNLTISGAIVVYQPPLRVHTTEDSYAYDKEVIIKYFKGMTHFFAKNEIPFVVALHRVVVPEVISLTLKNGGCYIDVPWIADLEAPYDLDNPLTRAVRECRLVRRSTIRITHEEKIHSITADMAGKFIRRQLKDKKMGRFAMYGATNISVKKALRRFTNCDINLTKSPNHYEDLPPSNTNALVGDPDANVTKMIDEMYSKYQFPSEPRPHLSIVITGRADNFSTDFTARTQNFLDTVARSAEKVPLAHFEIVFVDYAQVDGKPMSSELKIPLYLERKIRFITINLGVHMAIQERINSSMSFHEYIAKNIGIRRSHGRFVLVTNPDILLPTEFFESVAMHQFNKGVIYRADRWDLLQGWNTNHTLEDVLKAMDMPWTLDEIPIKKRCHTKEFNRFLAIDSPEMFKKHESFCFPGDFVMMYRKLWEAIGGFTEYPANPSIDYIFVSKMMRMVPGYVRCTLRNPILHQHHIRRSIYRPSLPNHTAVMDEYACTGRGRLLGKYEDWPDWGLRDTRLPEVRL